MIEGEDLELFERSLRHATEQHTGAALDAALAELGLARRAGRSIRAPRCRCCSSCRARPAPRRRRSTTWSPARSGASSTAPTAVVLPAIGRWRRARRRSTATGSPSAASAPPAWPASRRWSSPAVGDGDVAASWSTRRRSTLRPVDGVDPWLGLVEVHGEVDVADDAAAGRLGARPSPLGAARARPRARRRVAHDAASWPASTRSNASSSASRSRASRRSATAWPRRSSRSRRPTPLLDAAWLDRSPVTAAMAKAIAGRERPHRRPSLPAGARRHRLHHRARPAPLRAAHPRPRAGPRRHTGSHSRAGYRDSRAPPAPGAPAPLTRSRDRRRNLAFRGSPV